jgi:hypothetical protein
MGRDTLIEIRIPKDKWALADPLLISIYWKLVAAGLKCSVSHRKTRRTNVTQIKLDKERQKC